MSSKLYIYDQTSGIDRKQADGRFSGEYDVLSIGIRYGTKNLKILFDQLLSNNQRFDRVVFQTHGSSGTIWFGNSGVNANVWKTLFRGYEALFPSFTRIYFDGCNVAEGGPGTDFLIAAGHVFLIRAGGDVFGWKNLGTGLPGWVPFFGGHTIHLGGGKNLKRVRFSPGGKPNWPDSFI